MKRRNHYNHFLITGLLLSGLLGCLTAIELLLTDKEDVIVLTQPYPTESIVVQTPTPTPTINWSIYGLPTLTPTLELQFRPATY